jgi:CheY-like chemotaxis protein
MPKILIVDDSQTIVGMMKATLEEKGYEVVASYNGAEALEAVKNEAPDLILLDVMLPGMWPVRLAGRRTRIVAVRAAWSPRTRQAGRLTIALPREP